MNSSSIIIVGAEGSGTTLLWNCVARHPQLREMTGLQAPARRAAIPVTGTVLHLSLPTLRPMRWVGGWEVARGVRVIVLRRSPLHAVFSAYRRFYRSPRPAWRNYLRATALEASWIARHEPLCLAYEDLVHHPAAVLRRVFEFLGLDAGFAPPIQINDRNDERWRQDPRFASFVHRTFGLEPVRAPTLDDGAAAVAVAFRCYGTSVLIHDVTGQGVAEAVRAALPPAHEPLADAAPDASYTVERRTTAKGTIAFHVVSGGEKRFGTRYKAHVVAWLRREVDEIIAERSRRYLFVHAGVVGWRGHAILIPGRTMSGKSRLVTELVRCGATYYSDEFAIFADDGRVLPYAREPVLRDQGTAGAVDRDAAEPLPVGLIVSTSYRPGTSWQPQELRGVRALVPLIDNTVLAREESQRLLRLSAALAPQAVLLRGARAEAAEVAPQLLGYLDGVLAGGGSAKRGGDASAVVDRAQAVLDAAGALAPAQRLSPRYVRVDAFFTGEQHARLLAYALRRQPDFTASSIIDASGAPKIDAHFRRSVTLHDLDEIWELFAARLRRLLPHVRRELDVPWFPVGRIERQLTVHRQNDFFERHNDAGDAAVANRRITCVYYFHRQPKQFSGGDLKIYERLVRNGRAEPGPGHVIVAPQDNSAVFFASAAPHEVCPITLASPDFADSRFSITVWFSEGDRPGVLDPAAEGSPDATACGPFLGPDSPV